MNATPLRYPGGKSVMTSFFEELIVYNDMMNVTYAEPYAGGAGAAINLLMNEKVEQVKINDASISIFSFWNYMLLESERFIDKLYKVEVNLEEWTKQRKIYKTAKTESFELGFATFFLSRTNRSGILNAGPMGGQDPLSQTLANYKIDCRFNKNDLCARITNIAKRKKDIKVTNDDALKFIKEINNNNTLVYLDPPYYKQGKALYMNFYKHADHLTLAKCLKEIDKFEWVLSYDNVQEIRELYSDFKLYEFNLFYTAQNVKKGSELLTHSGNIFLPESMRINNSIKLKTIELLENLII
jgi:DNA adenine methylase